MRKKVLDFTKCVAMPQIVWTVNDVIYLMNVIVWTVIDMIFLMNVIVNWYECDNFDKFDIKT
jgi:hypothetical protein